MVGLSLAGSAGIGGLRRSGQTNDPDQHTRDDRIRDRHPDRHRSASLSHFDLHSHRFTHSGANPDAHPYANAHRHLAAMLGGRRASRGRQPAHRQSSPSDGILRLFAPLLRCPA